MSRTYIIAEAGVNHNGSIELAKKLVDVAAEAGADAVKFQTFKADKLVVKSATKADYQKTLTDKEESQYTMLKKLELSERMHFEIADQCKEKGIDFLSTPFDTYSLEFLDSVMDVPIFKIPSGEITNGLLLLKMAQTKKPLILSTGMSTLAEVEAALAVIAYGYTEKESLNISSDLFSQAYASQEGRKVIQEKVSILHCTSEYPAPVDEVNLRVMDTLRKSFGLPVGLSDHTQGIAVPIAAVARGAKIIEKHFTIDKTLSGPDHQASLDPQELTNMIKSIREVELSLGNTIKFPTASEVKNKEVVRKSLVANTNISKGEILTPDNIAVKRPGNGISPMRYWEIVGTTSDRDYQEGDLIQ
ncbi:N-acetylneuraminate synthase [Bacillus alkalicellulosilyticus]|uniref:N-acetylneuraminate synthase n=1 Tax=Alkalihalobacterium alkalicellulosilyticum TaxID=1912214 RepID=UPI000996024F|nr:N-acetylneuraminate synthase [Bacillus alkalicellulosilyticus]